MITDGVCVATYGVKSVSHLEPSPALSASLMLFSRGDSLHVCSSLQVIFQNITCRSPTLAHPILPPRTNGTWSKGCARIDGAMAIIYTSFGGKYPKGNSITLTVRVRPIASISLPSRPCSHHPMERLDALRTGASKT